MSSLNLALTGLSYVPAVVASTAAHIISGPARPSWTLKTSLIVALAQTASAANGKASSSSGDGAERSRREAETIIRVRNAIDDAVNRFTPVLKEGFSVAIDVPVKRLDLLVEPLTALDAVETGTRTLRAEWTVANETYHGKATASSKVVLFFHGGGFTICSAATHRPVVIAISRELKCRVLSVEYRLAPETCFPGALQDAVASYCYLVNEYPDLKIPPGNIFVAGDSAGGNLSAALVLYLRDAKLPKPGGAILISPATDLTRSLASWESNSSTDYLPTPSLQDEDGSSDHYLGGDVTLRTHPYVSPLLGDLHDLPPFLIQTGASETLMDDSILFAERVTAQGGEARLEIWADGIHVAQTFGGSIAQAQFEAIGAWGRARPADAERPYDFGEIDALLEPKWQERLKMKSVQRALRNGGQRDAASRSWTFIARKQEEAPVVRLRERGRSEVAKVLATVDDEARRKTDTWVYEAQKQVRDAWSHKFLDLLHLH